MHLLTTVLQRHVNWILWSTLSEIALIVNPEEAELLIPLVLDAETPHTHLLTYAAPVTRKMLHFNDLKYYAVPTLPTYWKAPSWLTIELGIFAGRLYFEYNEYSDLRKFLGRQEPSMKLDEPVDGDRRPVQLDGVEAVVDGADEATWEAIDIKSSQGKSFTNKPLIFLQEWLAVRRKGQDFAHTPMGYVCQDKPLTANHPFFGRAEHEFVPGPKRSSATRPQGRNGPPGPDGIVSEIGLDDDGGEDSYDEDSYDEDSYDGDEGGTATPVDVLENENWDEFHDGVDWSVEPS